MAKSTEITASLEGLGLGANEAAVYIAMLSLGPATVLSISRASGVKRTTIYNVLESLKQKGLVRTDVRGFKQLYAAEHPKKLESMLDTWNAVKAEWADERARLKDRSEELIARLKHDLAESRRKYREAYALWIEQLRNPHLLTATGAP